MPATRKSIPFPRKSIPLPRKYTRARTHARMQPRLRFGVAFYELTAESAAGSTGDTFVRTERGVWSVRKPRARSGAGRVLPIWYSERTQEVLKRLSSALKRTRGIPKGNWEGY